MRAVLDPTAVTLPPGVPVRVPIEVTNTLEVIDGVSAVVDFGPGLLAAAEPALLPLFPEDSGTIVLQLTAARHLPAGSYDLPVDLRSAAAPELSEIEHVWVVVLPEPDATVTVLPAIGVGRRRARFRVVVDNSGNVALDLRLGASDPDHAVRTAFSHPVLTVAPGESAETVLTTMRRRRLIGGDTVHQITVLATSAEVETSTKATFRHRPLIPRGAKTMMILAAIVAVWAGIFVFALDKALAAGPLTKTAPASFYAASPAAGNRGELSSLGGGGSYGLASSGGAPYGAVPKSGIVIGVGGTINGTVDAASTSAGIGRITVEAIRDSTHGPVLVSSAATNSDGTYSLPGLLPGGYDLRFSATGYRNVWWPQARSEPGARMVQVDALGQTSGIDTTITGDPGSITGTIDTGQSPAPPVTVTVQPEQGSTRPIATVVADASGHYVVPALPTPGVYDLSFSAAGYQVGTDNEELVGGQQETANTVVLTAATGTLSGTVTDGSKPVGGVTVTASADGQTFTGATPTSGAVGQFILSNLPTPSTYLVTFSKPGYGTRSVAEILGPGQSLTTVAVSMSGGTGDVDGQVDAGGVGLGGVTVTVDGTTHPVTTQTLTAGDVGGYSLSGLSTPSNLTLTFSATGYQSQTVPVALGSSGAAIVATVTLQLATGTVTGSVSAAGSGPISGVTATITDGITTTTTTTSSSPAGGFTFTDLAAGSYSLTFTATGYTPATVTVVLDADETTPAIVVTLAVQGTGS